SAIYPAGAVWPNVFYESLSVARTSRGAGGLDGAYNCGTFSRAKGVDDSTYAIGAAPGTSIRCQNFECGVAFVYGKFFSNQVDVKLYGDATAIEKRSGSATYDASDDFTVDVSETTSATLTLGGQTVYGDAPTCAVALTGTARIDARGLTSQSLTLNADSTLNVDGAKVSVGALTVADGANVAFSGVDAILAATQNATVGAATFSGTGYFATPQGTDASAATFAETVRVVDFCAEVKAFAATATGPTTATLAWSATDVTAQVCVERENAAAPNGWEVVATTPTEDASPLEVALSGKERFRIFDGAKFTVDSAHFPTGDFYVYVADDISAVATVAVEWETATQLVSAGNVMYRNENVLLLASIKNKLTAVYLSRDEVESATATVYAVSPGFGAREIWSPVDGWENIAVPLDAILEAPTEIDGWTLDAVGPNFVWTPDATTRPLFGDSGTFAVQVCVKRKSGGNPIYFTFRAVVK
ncbi:MAG: hypothetical protein IKU86_12020, partial [Thermoguttaceae bacterium]|nr:hypothetical protein [Thermoguttaceae bacterium]